MIALVFCLGVGGFIRIRCRIGLRTFLVLVTLMAVGLSFVAKMAMRVRRMTAATEELQRHGAAVHYDIGHTSDWFSTSSAILLPPWTAQVFGKAAFSKVSQVSFFQSTVKPKQMKVLADNFPEVTRLSFYQANIESGSFQNLEGLSQLTRLDLTNSTATDRDLTEQTPMLMSICLAGTKVTPEGLRAARQLRSLETIHADSALADDASITAIGPHTNLTFLSLVNGRARLTDTGVCQIVRNAPNLDVLTLAGNWDVTSDGAAEIARLKKVRFVSLSSTAVDDLALELFARN